MGLIELGSDAALSDMISGNTNVVITFSAHWCGPCRASKPALESLAQEYAADRTKNIKFGIVYENDLGETKDQYNIRAFPTHALFQQGREVDRVEGANIPAIEQMIQLAKGIDVPAFSGSGNTLGSSGTYVSPNEARLARLAKLGGNTPATAETPTPSEQPETTTNAAKEATNDEDKATPMEVDNEDSKPAADDTKNSEDDDTKMDATTTETPEMTDPTKDLNQEYLKTLTEEMGFSLLKAQKGLLYSTQKTVESAIEWLAEHQDDAGIDEPITPVLLVAQSYKCNECGKILSNMANLELHANKTGHSDFEESTAHVKPLTAEEKAAKILEIKELLKVKRAQREEKEQAEEIDREKQRRFMGKEMLKTKEQMDMEQRKRETLLRKKEKEAFKKERERLREQLARDKAERAAANGKLASKLSVEGYKPDMLQHTEGDGAAHASDVVEPPTKKPAAKKSGADVNRIPEYITKVSSYKAGGDGGKCLKILFLYIKNIVEHPEEQKYRTIKMDNTAYKTKVKPLLGAKNILLAVGFAPDESNDNNLVLSDDHLDLAVLSDTKTKLEAALVAYG